MAKKQQIILTHGTGVPTFDKNLVKRGEVLVRHAEDAKDAALYTPNNTEDAFLEFPSKAWVNNEITKVNTNAGQLGNLITALQTQVDNIDDAYQAADATLEGLIDAVDVRVKANEDAIADLQAADAAMDAAYKAADQALGNQISALDTRVAANASAITELQAADETIRGEFAAADSDITEAYTLADTKLKNDLTAEINKKADQEDFEALSKRVADVEGDDAGKSMRTVAADEAAKKVAEVVANAPEDFDTLKEVADWIRNDTTGAAALQTDVAKLKDVVDGYTEKGAIKTVVDALDVRVEKNEGAITDLVAADEAIRGELEQAVEDITDAYKAADEALETKLNGEIEKKADKTEVEALDKRVIDLITEIEKNEETTAKALTDLDTRVTKVYEDFAAADSALETKLNGEIAKKADKTTVEALDGRVAVVEGAYVKTIKYKDAAGEYVELPVVKNVVDLSGLVIDGGTY